MSKVLTDQIEKRTGGTAMDVPTSGKWPTANIADDAVTLAKMAALVRGKLIVGDSSGDPSALTVGTADQVLTSDGTDAAWADAAGGTTWQAVQTAAFTAVAGNGYPVNTTSAAYTVTLPATASAGDTIEFMDSHRYWGNNAVTLETNGLNYQGNEDPNPVYDTQGESLRIVYADAIQGWVPVFDGAVALETPQVTDIEWLVIAGGGSGGTGRNVGHERSGGAGGAGGYRNSYASEASGGGNSTETPISAMAAGIVLTATVGAGGAGIVSDDNRDGNVGGDSSLVGTGVSVTSAGGGFGGAYTTNGGAGGSGGGGGSGTGSYPGGAGTSDQGYAGGVGYSNTGGAGGGAAAVGANGDDGNNGGTGGAGLNNTITGSSVGRGGGGGGGGNVASTASHGGGAGGSVSVAGVAGTPNTGGGGGGGGEDNYNSGAGGSGVVILRMLTLRYTGTVTGSPTVTTTGLYTIVTFTGTGSYTT